MGLAVPVGPCSETAGTVVREEVLESAEPVVSAEPEVVGGFSSARVGTAVPAEPTSWWGRRRPGPLVWQLRGRRANRDPPGNRRGVDADI